MTDTAWILHDGTYTAVIWPFRSREEAETWRGEFCLASFVVEPIMRRMSPEKAPVEEPPRETAWRRACLPRRPSPARTRRPRR